MTKKLVAAATAAVLAILSSSAVAKPIKVAGSCADPLRVEPYDAPGFYTQFQTFKPTFSTLKSVRLATYYYTGGPLPTTVQYRLTLYGGTPETGLSHITSVLGYLLAGSTIDDAESGYTVTFTFEGGQPVVPGMTYTFQLAQADNLSVLTYSCMSYGAYLDGQLFISTTPQGTEDYEMLISGSGSPRAK